MSASAAAVPTPKPAKKTGLGWVRTPLAYFELAQILTYTEFVCLGLILRWTFGWDRPSAIISLWTFINTTGVTRQAVWDAIAALVKKGLIRVEFRDNGEREYFPILESEIRKEQAAVGKCGQCRRVGIFTLAQNFAYVPHSYFTQLPRCCDYSVYICVGVILAASMRWDRNQKDFTAIETALSVEDLKQITGYSERAVQGALKTAGEKGLIVEKEVSGRASLYSIQPEQFKNGIKLARKAARKLDREACEHKAKRQTQKTPQVNEDTETTPAVELTPNNVVSITKDFGRCGNCGVFGPIEPVKPEVAAEYMQNPTARGSPGPPQAPKLTPNPEPTQAQGGIVRDNFWKFLEACHDAGIGGSAIDLKQAQYEWARLSFEDRQAAVKGIRDRVKAGELTDPNFRPLPQNYLRKKIWQRAIRNGTSTRDDLIAHRNETRQIAKIIRTMGKGL